MQDVKAADSLQCRLNFVLLVTDGEANGPGDTNCGSTACANADPVAAGCQCRAVLAAYSMRKNLGVKTLVVGFATDAAAGSGFKANDNIAKAGGTDVGNDAKSPYAYAATSEKALTQAIQDAIYSAVEGSYATSPLDRLAGHRSRAPPTPAATYVLDSRVDFPSWRGPPHRLRRERRHAPCSSGTPPPSWRPADWKKRKVYTSTPDNHDGPHRRRSRPPAPSATGTSCTRWGWAAAPRRPSGSPAG